MLDIVIKRNIIDLVKHLVESGANIDHRDHMKRYIQRVQDQKFLKEIGITQKVIISDH